MSRHRDDRFDGSTPCSLLVAVLAVAIAGGLQAACATPGPGSSAAAAPGGAAVAIAAAPVPLNPGDPSARAIGDFVYAGGLALTSADTDRLHGLSDLVVTGAGRLTAIGDEGIVFEAQLVLDRDERLAGLADGRITLLTGDDGQPLSGKASADAEGLTQLADGDRLVSFERVDRILLYPAGGGRPRAIAAPPVLFPLNGGMEALAADPESGADAYIVGGEDSGETWNCRVSGSQCVKRPMTAKPEEFGLVALNALPGRRVAELLRAYDVERGNRIVLRILDGAAEVTHMEIAPPMTVDNFEGLAAVPGSDAHIRFYLISDDNGSARQRTLLLAFDWRPR